MRKLGRIRRRHGAAPATRSPSDFQPASTSADRRQKSRLNPVPSRETHKVRSGRMDLSEFIDVQPGVRGGKPCFIGTRITVYDVLEYLASGMTSGDIVVDFPELTEAHVRAALEFAAMRERRLTTPA